MSDEADGNRPPWALRAGCRPALTSPPTPSCLMSVGAWTRLFLWLGQLRLTATPERIDRVANVSQYGADIDFLSVTTCHPCCVDRQARGPSTNGPRMHE